MPRTKIVSNSTEFDKALHDLWDDIDLDTSAESFKIPIKDLIKKHVVGEHEVIFDLANPAYTVGRNVVRQEQRQILYGNKVLW